MNNMALSPQELQRVRELKANGVSMTLIMGDIAKSRQNQPSIVSDALKPQKKSLFNRVISDIPSDLKEGFLGVGEDLNQRGLNVKDAGEARIDGKQGFARTAFQQLGQVAGGVGDLISRGVTTAGKLFTTPEAEEAVSTEMQKVAQDTGLVDAYQKLQAYKEANPEKGRDIDATLGMLELALDRFGLGALAKGKEVVEQGVRTGVDTTQQAVRGAVDAVSDIKVPNIPNVAPGVTQGARDLAGRVPRAISNAQDNLAEKALRAERIRTSTPAVGRAIEVNVPDNTISLVTQSDTPTRQAMREMLDVAESGERGARPSRVAGEAVAKQYEVIDNQRKAVGKQLEQAIDNLPNATVDMGPAYKQLNDALAENGIRVGKDGKLDFTQSSLPTQQRAAVQRLYDLTTEAGQRMDAKMVHAKDQMFSRQKRADMKTDQLDDVYIKVNGETRSIYDTFRDIYRNQLDNLDNGTIRALNKDYAVLRNTIDEADNSIFKTSRTKGIEVDPGASAAVNLRRLEGEALSTPYFKQVADTLDSTSRVFGYDGAKPSDLITFAEDLRAIYPDTIPKTGFQGGIRTAIKPGLMDIAEKVINAGAPGTKDQQKALRALIDELSTDSPPFKAGATPPTSLLEEARKYKSAEEFVRGQGKIFRGSGGEINTKMLRDRLGEGRYFSTSEGVAKQYGKVEEASLSGIKTKQFDTINGYDDFVQPIYLKLRDKSPEWDGTSESALKIMSQAKKEANKELVRQGFDGVFTKIHTGENMIVVFPDSISKLKTRSQLEDIWKQANK